MGVCIHLKHPSFSLWDSRLDKRGISSQQIWDVLYVNIRKTKLLLRVSSNTQTHTDIDKLEKDSKSALLTKGR